MPGQDEAGLVFADGSPHHGRLEDLVMCGTPRTPPESRGFASRRAPTTVDILRIGGAKGPIDNLEHLV
jgi:hypothetical protein